MKEKKRCENKIYALTAPLLFTCESISRRRRFVKQKMQLFYAEMQKNRKYTIKTADKCRNECTTIAYGRLLAIFYMQLPAPFDSNNFFFF